jgi:molecular chaperone GrpE
MITLYDDVSKVIDSLHQKGTSMESYEVGQHLVSFREMIEEVLARHSVTPFAVQEDTFVPARQRTSKTVATNNSLQNKYIARRVRVGFEYEGTLLRPEIVEVYKYTPTNEK